MHRWSQQLILFADLVFVFLAFTLSHLATADPGSRGGRPTAAIEYSTIIVLATIVWTILYVNKRLGRFMRGWYFPAVFAQVSVAVFYLFSFLFAFGVLAYHRNLMHELLLPACLLVAGFTLDRSILHKIFQSPLHRRRVVIVGSGPLVRELLVKIARHPELSLDIAGVLFPTDIEESSRSPRAAADTVSLGTLNVPDLIQRQDVQDIILVEPLPSAPEVEQMLASCRDAGVRLHIVPQQYELYLSRAKLKEIEDVPLLSLEEQTLPSLGVQLKRVIDVFGALCLLLAFAPVMGVCAQILRRDKQKAFRRELRCGKNEARFWMYRMNVDRDKDDVPSYQRFMVRFSVTELPQLVNVLKGDMSLVGPRPEAPSRVKHYSMWHRQRLTVKPGLTGLAQAHGLREQHSSEEKVNFDLQYIFHWSLFLDLCLLVQTAWTLAARLVRENKITFEPLVTSTPSAGFEIGGMLHADSAQSGTD